MCSWCWGFSPVFEEVVRRYRDRVTPEVILGGLRPGNTQPFDKEKRAYILSHWREAHARTGQPFNFAFQVSADFTYDTEPASRAVRVVGQLASEKMSAYLRSVRAAFYVHNQDVTRENILLEIAERQGLDPVAFKELFRGPAMKKTIWEEFARARQMGVEGFPTLLCRDEHGLFILADGYQNLENLISRMNAWLAGDHGNLSGKSRA